VTTDIFIAMAASMSGVLVIASMVKFLFFFPRHSHQTNITFEIKKAHNPNRMAAVVKETIDRLTAPKG